MGRQDKSSLVQLCIVLFLIGVICGIILAIVDIAMGNLVIL